MPDYSLVPVDYQPDFSDFSLVPVDYDPFGTDSASRQAQIQPGFRPQQPAPGGGQPDAGPPADGIQTASSGESYDPNSEFANGVPASRSPFNPSPTSISPPDNLAVDWSRYNQPSGESKTATYVPTQRIGHLAADALIGLGMKPYFANDLTSRVGDVLGLSPLGIVGSALNLIDAKHHDDLPGALAAAAGVIPGAKGAARGAAAAAEETAAAIAKGGLSANATTGKYYSVWFETKLSPASYRASRDAHNREANENLLRAVAGDADHARIMQEAGIDLQWTPTGLAPRTPPAGFTWHHAEEPGVMQLVPRQQHERSSIFQDILHPNGRGGYSKWGKPLSSSD